MSKSLLNRIPSRVREKLGGGSSVCLLNGRDVFPPLTDEASIVMACNPRIKHVIPGIMKAAEELDAVVAFELTRTEGGVDGGYTGQTPEVFFSTVIEYAEAVNFTKPFIIHGDHITIKDLSPEELQAGRALVRAQIDAGYTSFALDASFNLLEDNIRILKDIAQPVLAEGYALEVELGEDKGKGNGTSLTTVEEAETFLSGLAEHGVVPQLLAIDNGSRSGNYLDGELIRIDLERTSEIHQIALAHGVAGLVQHGITGTPIRIVGKLADYGIRKGNIGTLWQNVAHAGLPLELMDAMRSWSRENRCDIKFATHVFKAEIDAIPQENILQIHEMAYREAKEFLAAFRAKGSATRLAAALENIPCVS